MFCNFPHGCPDAAQHRIRGRRGRAVAFGVSPPIDSSINLVWGPDSLQICGTAAAPPLTSRHVIGASTRRALFLGVPSGGVLLLPLAAVGRCARWVLSGVGVATLVDGRVW